MNTDTYILQKELPDAKIGDEFIFNSTYGRYYLNGNVLGSYWDKEYVENNSRWFLPKRKPIDMDIKVGKQIQYTTDNNWELKNRKVYVRYFNIGKDEIHLSDGNIITFGGFYENIKSGRYLDLHNNVFEPSKQTPIEPNKDYEILSFWGSTVELCKNPNGTFGDFDAPEDHLLSLKTHPIHSVKRISDNEVLTVGEKTKYGIIESFYEESGGLWVRMNGIGGTWNICEVVKLNSILKTVQLTEPEIQKLKELLK